MFSSNQKIRIFFTLSMWLVYLNIIQMMKSCMSLTRGRILFQVKGPNVGWLLGTSKVASRGHNLGAGVILGV